MEVGDKVRVTVNKYQEEKLGIGATGTIVSENDDGSCLAVVVDGAPLPPEWAYLNGYPAWAYYPYQLEVI